MSIVQSALWNPIEADITRIIVEFDQPALSSSSCACSDMYHWLCLGSARSVMSGTYSLFPLSSTCVSSIGSEAGDGNSVNSTDLSGGYVCGVQTQRMFHRTLNTEQRRLLSDSVISNSGVLSHYNFSAETAPASNLPPYRHTGLGLIIRKCVGTVCYDS